jgi:hypothetical protein
MTEPHHFDHIRRFYWHHCTHDKDGLVHEMLYKRYWRYMLMC